MSDESEFRIIPEIEEAGNIGPDEMSENEVLQLTKNKSPADLRKEAKVSEFQRSEDFKQHFAIIMVTALYLMALVVIVFGISWVCHIILPETMHWLNSDQVDRIQNIVTGGVLTGVIADQFRKKIL